MLYFVGVIIAFFLALLLISKKDKSGADKILALWLLFIGIHLLAVYLLTSTKYIQFPYLLGIELPMPLIHGPFLYLYCASLTQQHYKKGLRLLHFLPFVFGYIPFLGFLISSFENKILVYQNQGKGYTEVLSVMFLLFILSGVVYVFLSLQLLAKHKKNIANQFSYTEKINLAWLRYLTLGIMLIWICIIFGTDEYTFTAVVLYILFIGFFGIKQVGIFTHKRPDTAHLQDIAIDTSLAIASNNETEKYLKSGLGNVAANEIHAQLSEAMLNHKWYKNPELSLGKLSFDLDVPVNQLSQVINTKEQKSFYDYINQLRIEEFKRIVAQPENQKFTLLALAFDCGFNSKASFNRNFKKVTGLSPTEYLKSINIALTEK